MQQDENKKMRIEILKELNDKKYILDPLSVIIKLIILSKKPIGTKLCIYNNTLAIQEAGPFQSVVRTFFNNNKTDLSYLYNPIEIAGAHFINKENQNIKKLFILAIKGLSVLADTYKDSNTVNHMIILYTNIIKNYFNPKFNDKLFIQDGISKYYEEKLVKKLNDMWTPERLNIVLDSIELIHKDVENIKCLEQFMNLMDNTMSRIINEET